ASGRSPRPRATRRSPRTWSSRPQPRSPPVARAGRAARPPGHRGRGRRRPPVTARSARRASPSAGAADRSQPVTDQGREPGTRGTGFDTLQRLRALIRDVPDFPQEGIVFKDITPLLADDDGFSSAIDLIVVRYGRGNVDKVVGIEARGFILASPVAYHFGAGFAPVRKAGKLPWQTESAQYSLEYGTETLEIHRDALEAGERVLIVDDVLATGGTAKATASLVESLGVKVVGIACVI